MRLLNTGWLLPLLLTACPGFGDEVPMAPDTTPSWDMEIGPLMVQACGGCHTNPPTGGAPAGFRLDTYDTDEEGDGLPGAFDRRNRILARAVNLDPSPMPFTALPQSERNLLRAWIDAGAPKAPGGGGR